MCNEQQLLKDAAHRFVEKFTTGGGVSVDLHLIVVSVRPGDNGRLHSVCGAYAPGGILTQATIGQFASCVDTGISCIDTQQGASDEEGLEAVRRALDPSYVDGAMNPNFLRPEATLHTVYVSDEQEGPQPYGANYYDSDTGHWNWVAGWDQYLGHTIGGEVITTQMLNDLQLDVGTFGQGLVDSGRSPDGKEAYFPSRSNHQDFFSWLKGGSLENFRAHAVVIDQNSSCGSFWERGTRYRDFARQTHGTVSELCGDWTGTMDQLGLQASLQSCYELESVPTAPPDSIVSVSDDGVLIPRDQWWYEPTPNKVCLQTPPAIGSNIVIVYH